MVNISLFRKIPLGMCIRKKITQNHVVSVYKKCVMGKGGGGGGGGGVRKLWICWWCSGLGNERGVVFIIQPLTIKLYSFCCLCYTPLGMFSFLANSGLATDPNHINFISIKTSSEPYLKIMYWNYFPQKNLTDIIGLINVVFKERWQKFNVKIIIQNLNLLLLIIHIFTYFCSK